jgi:hypothetical protein
MLRWYRDFILEAPEELNGFFMFMTIPPAPPFPPQLHGKKVCGVVWCWNGPAARADEVLAPVRALKPLLFGVQPMPFPMLQSAFDGLYPPGHQWYWKADFVRDIPDAAVAEHAQWGAQLPTPLSAVHMYPIDGAAQRVAPRATAFSYRDANWNMVIVGVDPDPASKPRIVDWTRKYYDAIHRFSAGGAYVNFLQGDEGGDRVRASYRESFPRLVEVKRRYDPDNRFRINQNIDPNASVETAAPPP